MSRLYIPLLVAAGLVGVAPAQAPSLAERVQPALVIIRAGEGSGSGFILEMDGSKYLVTNEHVIRGGSPLRARDLAGNEYRFSRLEVAVDRDLARMRLRDQDVPALTQGPVPAMNAEVLVYGNSQGANVVTELGGRLLGVGEDKVEVSNPFVGGNSGSPILDREGNVFGVATFVARGDGGGPEWVRQGTRFDQARRFGERLDGVRWLTLSYPDYQLRADALADFTTYLHDLRSCLVAMSARDTARRFRYEAREQRGRYRRHTRLPGLLEEFVTSVKAFYEHAQETHTLSAMAQASGGRNRDIARRRDMADMQRNRAFERMKAAYEALHDVPAREFQRHPWRVDRFEQEATAMLAFLRRAVDPAALGD